MEYLFIFIIGAAIGSFLNVLIDRLPNEESIMGRSHCDYCKKTLSPWDLIPVLSYLFLKGKCRYCGKKLSMQYPLIELLTGIVFVLIYNFQVSSLNEFSMNQFSIHWLLGNWNLIANWILKIGISCCFIVIFFADVKYHIIPDEVQIGLFMLMVIMRVMEGLGNMGVVGVGWVAFDAIVVMVPILFLYLVTKGHGMGFGDVKLAFNIGILLGIKNGLAALYFAFIFGAIYGVTLLILRKKKMKSKIAFGPFIILGVLITVLFQTQIHALITRMYGF